MYICMYVCMYYIPINIESPLVFSLTPCPYSHSTLEYTSSSPHKHNEWAWLGVS